MLHVVSFTFNPFYENTYLIINERNEAIVVDPGMSNGTELMEFFTYIEQYSLTPVSILNTHAHIDHILGVTEVKQRYKIPFLIHKGEIPILENAAISAQMFGLKLINIPEADNYLKENEMIPFGASQLEVLLTPGHSPGSISFYAPNEGFIISGDVLFQNSIGRTDLPGGNYEQLVGSIKNTLFPLPGDTKVYPGHGSITMIRIEKHSGFLSKCL